jgi:ABC-type glycerol-3-phosphate transport system substrate-binding protein
MYWNRTIFSNANVSLPPKYWDEFFTLSPRLTLRNQANTITRATVALGEYQNIPHAKDILATLILQAGNPIVARSGDGLFHSTLGSIVDQTLPLQPTESALRFYTEFSNAAKNTYSWNRALPNARDMFTAGDLAIYFGFASELPGLRSANPNLNIDVTVFPQARDATRITYGHLQALSIPRGAKNPTGALEVARALSAEGPVASIVTRSVYPPPLRSLLAQTPSEAFRSTFFESALIARGWRDPDPERTATVFQDMIEGTISGRLRLSEAVAAGSQELENVLRGR